MFTSWLSTIKMYYSTLISSALLIAFITSNLWSYNHGLSYAEGTVTKDQVKQLTDQYSANKTETSKALEDYKKKSDIDLKIAIAKETERQSNIIKAMQRRINLENDIKRNPRSSCDLDPTSFSLLVNAIIDANGQSITNTSGSSENSGGIKTSPAKDTPNSSYGGVSAATTTTR